MGPFDLDESQLKKENEKWKIRVDNAMSKLQEDCSYNVMVDEVEGIQRVTITFIENADWPNEECKKVRDQLISVLAQQEDFEEATDIKPKDPITPQMIEALKEEQERL